MTTDLEPFLRCPFCGGEVDLESNFGADTEIFYAYMCCSSCGAETKKVYDGYVYDAERKAIDLWNRREATRANPWRPISEYKPEMGGVLIVESDNYNRINIASYGYEYEDREGVIHILPIWYTSDLEEWGWNKAFDKDDYIKYAPHPKWFMQFMKPPARGDDE